MIVPFNFDNTTIRVVTDDNGEPLFVGKDLCEALGYANPTDAMNRHCKGVVKRYPLQTAGGMQEVRALAEPDVMRLIVSSKLPSAARFEAWVFEEVLPSIRKTGGYAVAAPSFHIPQTYAEAMRVAANLAEENDGLRSENTQLKAQLSRPAPAALSHAATLLEKTARSLRSAGVSKRKALGQALDLVHGQTGINLLPNYSATQDNVALVVKIVGNAKKYSKDSKYGEFCASGIMPKNKLMGLSKLPVAEMNEAVDKAIELGLLDPCAYHHDKTAFMVRH